MLQPKNEEAAGGYDLSAALDDVQRRFGIRRGVLSDAKTVARSLGSPEATMCLRVFPSKRGQGRRDPVSALVFVLKFRFASTPKRISCRRRVLLRLVFFAPTCASTSSNSESSWMRCPSALACRIGDRFMKAIALMACSSSSPVVASLEIFFTAFPSRF